MLDIKFIRQNPEKVKQGCIKKQAKVDIDYLLEVDEKRRMLLQAIENMRAQKNKANEKIRKTKDEKEKAVVILEMQELDRNSDRLITDFKKIDKEFYDLMFQIPNLPFDDVPIGKDEKENVVLREIGEKPKFDFEPKNHLELGEALDLIDIKRAAKISGSRFGFIKKEAVMLEFALINFAMDILTKEGFVSIIPPVMIKKEIMKGMGYIDTKEDLAERFFLEKDGLFLVGTSEQAIGPMHKDEIFEEKELPRRYAGFSTCFREEAGSYGKDTKGILRVHQFDKLEMFSFCKPEESKKEHQILLAMGERLMQLLKIPYRVVQLCAGDLSRPAAATFDIEAWIPSQEKYRETHSTSNCIDFQAGRLNIRWRDKSGKINFVHTLNGTAFAIGRILIAILENYQQKDGSIKVPKVLQKYLGFKKIRQRLE
jgi:seryl-tRNA synthetase